MIVVEVRNMQRKQRVDSGRIEDLAVRALRMVGREGSQLSIVVVNDRRIRELNRLYRGRDSSTDVLAFSQLEGDGAGIHTEVMGDVVISAETAARQCAEAGDSLEDELDLENEIDLEDELDLESELDRENELDLEDNSGSDHSCRSTARCCCL